MEWKTVHIYDVHHTFCSPDGILLASINDCNLTVRLSKTLSEFQTFHCFDSIKAVKWSPDSKMVACVIPKRNLIDVFTIDSGEKVAVLRCSLSGGGTCFWGPSSSVLLVTEPYLLRALVWSLDDEASDMFPKILNELHPWAKSSAEFSPDGKWLLLVQKKFNGDPKLTSFENNIRGDSICLISCITWRMTKRIECHGLNYIAGVSWNPSSKLLIIWSDEPSEPVLFVDIPSGEILSKWLPEENRYLVGIIQVCWSPSGQFVALMTYNDHVFIIGSPKWKTMEVLVCREEIECKECDVYHEVWEDEHSLFEHCCVKLNERPVSISRLPEDVLCPTLLSPSGNGRKLRRHCAWSSGGRYLAVNSVLAPATVWIWNLPDGFILNAVVVLADRLLELSWDPVGNTLAMCCGLQGVVLWSKSDETTCVSFCSDEESSSSPALRLTWSPTASFLIVGSERISRVLKYQNNLSKNNDGTAGNHRQSSWTGTVTSGKG